MSHSPEFCCRLDGQPDHLTPEHHLQNYWTEELDDHPLFLNKNCRITSGGELPPALANEPWLTDGFATIRDMAWVRDPASDALQPFWLGPQTHSILKNIQDGKPASVADKQRRHSLAIAKILVPQEYETSQQARMNAPLSRCSDQIRQSGYAPIRGLLHPFHISALRRYYRNLIRTGKLPLGDSQSSRRYYAHNERVARFFHFQLASTVSTIVGQPVKPSYVYFGSYQGGAILEEHIDRAQCEFSVTMCVDYSPEPRQQTPWPIQLRTPSGTATVYQALGDALVYMGCKVPHSRGVLPLGHTSSSLFFHYVPGNFTGSLD
jgi:hypothetical protein